LRISLFLFKFGKLFDCDAFELRAIEGDSDLRKGGIDVGFVFEYKFNF